MIFIGRSIEEPYLPKTDNVRAGLNGTCFTEDIDARWYNFTDVLEVYVGQRNCPARLCGVHGVKDIGSLYRISNNEKTSTAIS